MHSPLDKVVFIQKIAAFASRSLSNLIQLNYVNNSWSDTINTYASHLFEERATAEDTRTCKKVLSCALKQDILWLLKALLSKAFVNRINCILLACEDSASLQSMQFIVDQIEEAGRGGTTDGLLLKKQLTQTDVQKMNCLWHICFNPASSKSMITLLLEKFVEVGGADLVENQLCPEDEEDDSKSDQSLLRLTNLSRNDATPAELFRFVASLLHHFNVFKLQYSDLPKGCQRDELKEKAGIDSASWVPDDESVAEVKRILEGKA